MGQGGMEKYINAEDALARLGGLKKIYAKTLHMFLGGKELEHFDAALLANELGKASGHIHTLKGVAGNLSLTELYNQSEPLIQKLRRGDLDSKLIEAYRETYARTRSAVEELIPQLNAD